MLSIVGLGLDDGEITQKGLEELRKADKAFSEFYTNTKTIDLEKLEKETGTEIEELSREEVEQREVPVENAEDSDICFLVSGDPLTATTHYDIKERAEERGTEVKIVHAPSILTSVAETGLNVYKFGRVVTIPEEGKIDSIIEMMEKNDSVGLHTLVLLDIGLKADEAAEKLKSKKPEWNERTVVVLERANSSSQNILTGTLQDLSKKNFGEPPHCFIMTGELSHKEKEFLKINE